MPYVLKVNGLNGLTEMTHMETLTKRVLQIYERFTKCAPLQVQLKYVQLLMIKITRPQVIR